MNPAPDRPADPSRFATLASAALALLLVAAVYWPVRNGGFVWDDIINFVENDWLSSGAQWQHYVLRDFNGWTNYFRPLVVGFFTLQIRAFDSSPGAMHLVSLGLHLANTCLVGLLARHCSRIVRHSPTPHLAWTVAAMVFYGLHPALIEAVAWIGVQFDLIATLFMLLGTWAALALRALGWRALATGVAFFLAACSKESAAVFPAVVLLVDWLVQSRQPEDSDRPSFLRAFLRRNALLIAALALAGLAYLAFRAWGLGYLMHDAPPFGGELSLLGSIQKVIYTHLQYWRMILLPIADINPVHSFATDEFERIRPGLLAFGGLSLAGLAWAVHALLSRRSAWGGLFLLVTLALLPVLNLLPTGFAVSLYHQRYVITALAFGTAILPLLPWPRIKLTSRRLQYTLLATLGAAWVISSLATIRVTVPLWLDDESVWRWALSENPTTEIVQYNLTAALLRNGRLGEANAHVDRFFSNDGECARCAIEVAKFEIDRGDTERAAILIDRAGASRMIRQDLDVYGDYLLAAGRLAAAEGDPQRAFSLLSEGLEIKPQDPVGHVSIAEVLLSIGRPEEALNAARRAVALADDQHLDLLQSWLAGLKKRSLGDGELVR
ncbi:tetratricopeptide repeat protein [Luteimonas sp. A537]